MKDLFVRSVAFIKENPGIILSLVLVVFIPAAIFFNTLYTVGLFEKNIDIITHEKAILAENIINQTARGIFSNPEELSKLVADVTARNDDVRLFEILAPTEKSESFRILSSNNVESIGREATDFKNVLAWSREEGIATLVGTESERFWNVTKSVRNEAGEKLGLVSLSFSLATADALVNRSINRSYVVLFFTVCVVLLLVSNQTRLFGYALTVQRLKEVDKMKDTFVSMASHELRSPLTAIRGNLEFLTEKHEKTMDEESWHFLSNIITSVDRLNALINDILEVSRAEGNRLPMTIAATDPIAIISGSVEEMRAAATRKSLDLRSLLPESLPLVLTDPERLKQILVNLLSNAIKYTSKGSVEVTTAIEKKMLVITVADTGFGMSSEDQKNLFQKFYRIQNSETKNIVGTGLGLWIVRELARKMRGDITVESIKGVGSHFSVRIPLA